MLSSLFIWLSVCLFVCLFVCLLATLPQNVWTDLHEISGKAGNGPVNKNQWLNFGGEPHDGSRSASGRRHYWEIRKVVNGHLFTLIRQMTALVIRALAEVCTVPVILVMAALRNRAGHYFFALQFLSIFFFFFFSSPNLSRRRLDVYHICTHGVALVQI